MSRQKRRIKPRETEYMSREKQNQEARGGNIQMYRGYGMAIHCGEGTNIQGFSKKMEAERDGRWSTDDKTIQNRISFMTLQDGSRMTDRKVWKTNLQMQNESFLQCCSFNTFGLVIQYL